MNNVVILGDISKYAYKDIDEAWSKYVEFVHGDKPMDAQRYHQLYFAFLVGGLSHLNVTSQRYNDSTGKMDDLKTALVQTMNDCLERMKQAKR